MQEVWPQEGQQSVPSWSADGKSIALAMNVSAPNAICVQGIYLVDWETRKATKLPESDGLDFPDVVARRKISDCQEQ